MSEHKQVRIRAGGQEAYVDEGIAPLIKEIWQAGIRTNMSCQEGTHGYVWVNFDCAGCAARFMDIVATYEEAPDSLYQRMVALNSDTENNWIYGVLPEDSNCIREFEEDSDTFHESNSGPVNIKITVSIWFPPSDLPEVLDRLRCYVAQERQLANV